MSVDQINAIGLATFALGLTTCAVSVGVRMLRFYRCGITQPRLIWRDVMVFGLMGVDFLIVLIHRVAGLPYADELWFSLLTVTIAVSSVAIWLYFELLVIGHRRDR